MRRVGAPAVDFQPGRDEVETQARGDLLHELLLLGVLELDDVAAIDVDQVVMPAVLGRFVARAAAAEIAAFENAPLLEQAHGAIDRGDGDARVQGGGAAVELLDIGVVGGVREHAGDDPALAGHLQALGHAEALDARFHADRVTPFVGVATWGRAWAGVA